jgi:hypothetical protein
MRQPPYRACELCGPQAAECDETPSQPIADCIAARYLPTSESSQLFFIADVGPQSVASRIRFRASTKEPRRAAMCREVFLRTSRAECCPLLRPVWRCPDGGRIECGRPRRPLSPPGPPALKLSIERGPVDQIGRTATTSSVSGSTITSSSLTTTYSKPRYWGRMSTIVAGTA